MISGFSGLRGVDGDWELLYIRKGSSPLKTLLPIGIPILLSTFCTALQAAATQRLGNPPGPSDSVMLAESVPIATSNVLQVESY